MPFAVSSRYFAGACEVTTYGLNELLGTKLRALYQRRKGRDLFDLAVALGHANADPARIVEAFRAYMEHGRHGVSRGDFEENLARKMTDLDFIADIGPLLASGYAWESEAAAAAVRDALISRLE
jgi:predicted nucleotidyltransferase component of viral defense system